MSDEDIELRFGADASAVGPAAVEVKGQVAGISEHVGALSAGMKAMGASAVAAFNESTAAAKENTLAVKEAAHQVKEFREFFTGVGEAVLAAFAVEAVVEFVNKMGEASEKTLHTAQTFGLTVGEVQKMNAQAALFGVPAEAMATAMQRVDKSFATAKEGGRAQSDVFKELGINIHGSYTQTQLMSAALDGLSKMDAGPAKVAAAMAIFGKNIQAIGPLLGLTAEQIAEANKTVAEFGAVNETATMKGAALAESLNTSKVAGMGLNNVFTDAMAPAFKVIVDGVNELTKGFINSYKEGGAAKVVMDALAWSVKALADAVGTFGMLIDVTFKAVLGGAQFLAYGLGAVCDAIAGAILIAIHAFETFGKVARDALTLNWGAIQGDIKTGIARVSADVVEASKRMGADAAEGFKKGAEGVMSADKDGAGYEAWAKKLWGASGAGKGPAEGTGTTAADPSGKPKHAKAGGAGGEEAEARKVGEQILTDARQRFQEQADAHKDMIRDEQADELAFWETFKASADYQKLTAEQKQKLQIQLDHEVHQVAIGGIRDEIAARHEADGSAIAAIQAKQRQSKASVDQQIRDIEDAEKRGLIGRQDATNKIVGLINQEKQAALDAAQAILQIKANTDAWVGTKAVEGTAEFKAAQKDQVEAAKVADAARVTANDAAADKIDARNRKSADDFQKMWEQRVGGVVSTFGAGIEGMVNHTKTFQQAMLNVAASIESSIFRAVEGMVTRWISGEIAKTMATAAGANSRASIETGAAAKSKALSLVTAEKQIFNDALKAASGAYSAMAGIPIIGPALGAGAAAVTFAAVEAYGQMASAAGGYDIPAGVNPVVQTHAQEMILPTYIANPLRGMIADYGSSGGGGGFGGAGHSFNFGDFTVNGGPTSMSPREFQRALDDHRSHVAEAVSEALRQGFRPRHGATGLL